MARRELSKSEEKLVNALSRRRERERQGLFIAEGVRVAEEFLAAGIDLQLALLAPSLEDTARGKHLARTLGRHDAVRHVSDHALERLAATESPQGVLLAGRIPRQQWPHAFASNAVVLVLDAVQDPGNFGTLARTAAAFGVAALIALEGTVDPWNPKAVRAAAGASFRIPILPAQPDRAFTFLREHGFRILAADAHGEELSVPAAGRNALIVGNEGAGLSAAARAAADAVVSVPTPGPVESLNVGTAAGILLYLLTRERAD
jgi:TrmH family RNA methyltransferase